MWYGCGYGVGDNGVSDLISVISSYGHSSLPNSCDMTQLLRYGVPFVSKLDNEMRR